MNKLLLLISCISLLAIQTVQGQLTVQDNLTAQQLANNLAGSDITVFNAELLDTLHVQSGTFNYIGNDLGLNAGVILSTGEAIKAIGPNTLPNTQGGHVGFFFVDTLLEAIAGANIADLCSLDFEFEVPGDEISFNFTFLSEEYSPYGISGTGNGSNDAFAFVISGPGIVGEENLAIVPNSNIPITTRNINLNNHWQHYIDNTGAIVNIEYDGFTRLLTAKKTGLQPCGVYKLSLRIADGTNSSYDSAVMLEANSLVSNSITVAGATHSTDTTALEGCIAARYIFDLGYVTSQDLNIPIQLGGTAVNGVDYEHIDSIITIPAGQSSSTLIVNALSDGLLEGRESVDLYYRPTTSLCVPLDTVTLYIDDATPLSYDAVGTNLSCSGDTSGSIMVNIVGGTAPYEVSYTDTLTGNTQSILATNLPITGLDASTYLLEVSDQYGCSAEAIVSGGLFNAGQSFLPDGTGASYSNNIAISGFNVGQNLTSINQINSICATMEHSYAGDLTIELIAPNGASIQLKGVGSTGAGVYTCNLGEPVASGPVDAWSTSNLSAGIGYEYCWTATPTYPTMTAMISPSAPGPPPTYTYTTLAGNTYTDYYLPQGAYAPRQSFYGLLGTPLNGNWNLQVTDNYAQDNGYLFEWSISLKADLPDSIVTLSAPVIPTVSHTTTDPSCGSSNGAISLTPTGAFPPFTYLWNTGAITKDILGLTSGTYTVTMTESNGCDFEYQVNLSNSGATNLTTVVTPETCVGTTNGTIDLSVGVGSFSYQWSNAAVTEDLSGLTAGDYTVTVDDGGNCLGIATYTIDAAVPLIVSGLTTNENCGDREGMIHLGVQGGELPYTYAWSNGLLTQNLTDLQQGTYWVTVEDANSCSIVGSFVIVNLVGDCIPSCDLAISNTQVLNEICADANGSIDVTTYTTGGTINYLWSTGATTQDISGLALGNYSLTMSDVRGCELVKNYTIINQTNGLNVPLINVKDDECGKNVGALYPVAYGGAQPYAYLWSNGATSQNLVSLSDGTYTCTITDANGCSYINSAVVKGSISLAYQNVWDATCSDSTGSIDIDVVGGVYPWTYLWSNGETTEDLKNIPVGTYSVTITDGDGCTLATQDYIVNNNSGDFQLNYIDVDAEICGNGLGDIIVSTSGGTAPYFYAWSTGDTTVAINNLSAGTYSATISDSSGCVINTGDLNLGNTSGNLTVDQIIVLNENCGDGLGIINLYVSGNTGALSYLWSTGSNSQNLSNLSAGNYSCTISDALGCEIYANASVMNNSGALSISNIVVSDENCSQQDGSLDLSVLGATSAVSYQWSNGGTTEDLVNVTGGSYTVTVTDTTGCTVERTAFVQNYTGTLTVFNPIVTNEYCANAQGRVDLSVSGGTTPYTYLWSNGMTIEDAIGLVAGSFSCTITDATSCSFLTETYIVNNSSSMTAGLVSITEETCTNQDGVIDISITGGMAPYTYLWSNGATTEDLIGLTSNIYSCTITDMAGCALHISHSVLNSINGLAVNVQITDEQCSNSLGAIDLTVVGATQPYTYLWSNGAITEDLVNLNQGNYQVTISDFNGCQLVETYFVNNSSGAFHVFDAEVVDETCNDGQGAIDVHLANGQLPFTYQWSNGMGTQDILGLEAAVYTQTITDNNGCVIVHSTSVLNNGGDFSIFNDSIVDASCGNPNGWIDLTTMNGTAPYSYHWSNGAITEDVSALAGGVYTCVATDFSGCQATYSTTLTDNGGDLQISNLGVLDNRCGRGNGTITATIAGGSGPYTYSLGTTAVDSCGYYTLVLYSHDYGWPAYDGITAVKVYINSAYYGVYSVPNRVGSLDDPSPEILSFLIPVCEGDSIALEYLEPLVPTTTPAFELLDNQGNSIFSRRENQATPGFVYSDVVNSFFVDESTNYFAGLVTGTYTLTVTDANGCSLMETVEVNDVSDSLNISLDALIDETCGHENGTINLGVTGAIQPTYLWNTGVTSEDLTSLSEGVYSITVSDINGCSISDTYWVSNDANGIEVTDTIISLENCGNSVGAIDVSFSGGLGPLSFLWSNGLAVEDISGLTVGTYSLTITDASSCNKIEQYYVGNIGNGMTVTTSVTNETCINMQGAIDLTVSGGLAPYLYSWSNGATTEDLLGLSEGIYTCSITDATGCSFVWGDTVSSINSQLFIPSSVIAYNRCDSINWGAIYLTVDGGAAPYTYLWSDSSTSQDIEEIYHGTHVLTVTDVDGCELVDSFIVKYFSNGDPLGAATHPSVFVLTPEVCNNSGGALDIYTTPFPPITFLWSNGATTEDISGLSAGVYTVTATRFSSSWNQYCVNHLSLVVPHDMGDLSIDSTLYLDESCNQTNGTIDLFVSGGTPMLQYQWSNGATTEDITALSAGFYEVTITDSIGCYLHSPPIEIENLSHGLGVSSTFLTDEQCSGEGAIDITVAGGVMPYTYLWSNGATTEDISGLNGGVYFLTLTEAGGCTFVDDYTVNAGSNVISVVGHVAAPTCGLANGVITAVATNGTLPYSYQWFNGATSQSVSGLASGNYDVTVSGANGCPQTVQIALIDTSQVNLLGAIVTNTSCGSCSDGIIDLSLSNSGTPYSFIWSNGSTTEDLTNGMIGSYSVTITNNYGCIIDTTFDISTAVAINSISKDLGVKIYPNPSNGEVFIEIDFNLTEDLIVEVYNTLGQLVQSESFEKELLNEKVRLSLYNVTSGAYLVRLQTGERRTTEQIIIQKW